MRKEVPEEGVRKLKKKENREERRVNTICSGVGLVILSTRAHISCTRRRKASRISDSDRSDRATEGLLPSFAEYLTCCCPRNITCLCFVVGEDDTEKKNSHFCFQC